MASIDETHIVNGELPKTWTCPHCHRRNKMGGDTIAYRIYDDGRVYER